MATVTNAEKAWKIALAAEPKLQAALEKALTGFAGKVNTARVQAYIIAGDWGGLSAYLNGILGGAFASSGVIATLDKTVAAAGAAAAVDINAFIAKHPQGLAVLNTHVAHLGGGIGGIGGKELAAILVEGAAPGFTYNPINPKTIQATKTWQAALINKTGANAYDVTMATIKDGLMKGENPRTTARAVRRNLGLTTTQAKAVINFSNDLDGIVENGLRSAQSWGLYTPKQIQALKAADPKKYKQMNFTAKEIKGGRRWGKISRASGTLALDPKTGLKPSKPIGFVAPSTTQGGTNAFRLGPDGKPIDAMTSWRLRDKTFDPYIYRVVEAEERLTAARAVGDPNGIKKAQAGLNEALSTLKGKKGEMADRYRERYIKHRSEVIARTEAMRATNLGTQDAWRQAIDDSNLFTDEQVSRKWKTAQDDRVREAHRAANGQEVGLNEPFKVGGVSVMIPPHGPNCRCAVGFNVDLSI